MNTKQKIIELNDVHDLFMDIQNENLKKSLIYKLSEDIDTMINKYDSLYFKAYTNRKYRRNLIKNTDNERHDAIINTHNTMNTFMPYILLHNLTSSIHHE